MVESAVIDKTARAGTREAGVVLESAAAHLGPDAEAVIKSHPVSLPHLEPDNPTLLEKVDSSPVTMAAWQIPMLPMLAGVVAAPGNWLGKLGKPGEILGKPFKWLSTAIKAPHEFLDKHTVGEGVDAASRGAGYVKRKVSGLVGSNSGVGLAGGTGGAVAVEDEIKTAAAGGAVKKAGAMERGLETVGGHIDKAIEHPVMKPVKWLRDKNAEYHLKKAHGDSTKIGPVTISRSSAEKAKLTHSAAHGHLDDAIKVLGEDGKQGNKYTNVSLKDRLSPATDILKKAKEDFRASSLSEVTAEAAAAGAAGSAATAGKPIAHVIADRTKALEEAGEAFATSKKTILANLKAEQKAAVDAAIKSGGAAHGLAVETAHKAFIKDATDALNKAEKSMGKFTKKVTHAHGHIADHAGRLEKVAFRSNFKEGLKGIPEKISQMKGIDVVNHGLYYATQGATAVRTARLFTSGMGTLKHMYASITGEDIKKVSTYHIMFGDVPESMKEARSQYMKSALPQAAANVVGMDVFRRMMKSGASGKTIAIGMGAQVVAGIGGSLIADKNSLLEAYKTITVAQEEGKDIPAGAYLALLIHASPKKIGQLDENDQKLLNVAKEYAKEKMTAGQVMHELDTGAFDKRYAAAPSTAVADAPAAKTPAAAVEAKSPTPSATAEAKPVVGSFSAKLAGENRGSTRASALPGSHVEALQKNETSGAVRA